jgi:quinol monooxygenase YgiN
MSVLVTMQVGPVDAKKFDSAVEELGSRPFPGLKSRRVLHSESDPSNVLMIEEWESHDAFHAASDEAGDEFNAKAGTEGLEWVTGVWEMPEARTGS